LEFLLAVFLGGLFLERRFQMWQNFLCVDRVCIRPAKCPESLGIYFPEETEGGGGVPPPLYVMSRQAKLLKLFKT